MAAPAGAERGAGPGLVPLPRDATLGPALEPPRSGATGGSRPRPSLVQLQAARPGLAVPSLGWAGSAGHKANPPGWGAQPRLTPSGHPGFEGAAGAGASPTEVGATQGGPRSAPLTEVWDRAGLVGPDLGDSASHHCPQRPRQAGLGGTRLRG